MELGFHFCPGLPNETHPVERMIHSVLIHQSISGTITGGKFINLDQY